MKRNYRLTVFISFFVLMMLTITNYAFALDIEKPTFDEFGFRKGIHDSSNMQMHQLTSSWETYPEQSGVSLTKQWTVTFNQTISATNIVAMVIEKDGVFIPVTITLNAAQKKAIISPVNGYDSGSQYSLRIILDGGKQYRMNFTTVNADEVKYFASLATATSRAAAVYPLKKNQFIKTYRDYKSDTYYKLDLKEGEGTTVAIRAQIDKDSMNIFLYDSEGSQFDYEYISNGQTGTVTYKVSSDKTMYIKVGGETGVYYIGFYDNYYNNTSSDNDQRDYFGSLYTAKKVTEGIKTKDDPYALDFYRVNVLEGQTLTVSCTPQIDKDSMNIFLYDSEESQLDYEYMSNGQTGTVSKKASRDCTYFIKIGGSAGKYNLQYSTN